MKKFVIIGGMAAGCRAATHLKRICSDYQVTIIEKKPFLSFGACGMPMFASGDVDSFMELATTPWGTLRDEKFFRDVKNVTALTNSEVIKIDKDNKSVSVRNLKDSSESELDYDYLLISTGAGTVDPPFPVPESDKITTFHDPEDSKTVRKAAQSGQVGNAVIIGGGFIGCELAEALSSLWGIEVKLIEIEDRLLGKSIDKEISAIFEEVMKENDIELKLSAKVSRIDLDEEGNPVVELNSGEKISTDMVCLCLGIQPETRLARSIGCEIGSTGAVKTDHHMLTNIPNVFAAGDCCEIKNLASKMPCNVQLGSLANRQGRVIAEYIAGNDAYFPGSAAVISLKIFDFIVASAGMTETAAKKDGFDFDTVIGSWYDRPDYHPDNRSLYAKLIYEKSSLRVLGFQICGYGEVTRYIDAFSALISNDANCLDLTNFEHAYMPAHSGPMNCLNDLGAMAIAQERSGIRCLSPEEINPEDYGLILDLRLEEEAEESPLPYPNVTNIPIEKYRSKIDEFDKSKSVLTICHRGTRAYEAACVLAQEGFRNLSYVGGGASFINRIIDKNI